MRAPQRCAAAPSRPLFAQSGAHGRSPTLPIFLSPVQILAGRLGFEPRQSDPKALDLPLVDRPINFRLRLAYTNNWFQYSFRVRVLVTCAVYPIALTRLAASSAISFESKKP